MRCEVGALVCRGIDEDAACSIVGLPRVLFWGHTETPIKYLPTPDEIERATERIKAGELDTGKATRRRSMLNALTSVRDDDAEAFDLAGRIDEDDVTLPEWLYAAGV
ncbi:MAG: hypothetical protein F9B45_09745 [Phycisphaera sp. RhM]|nr:hypothetical protein [Phycisphaera sp. RhM]